MLNPSIIGAPPQVTRGKCDEYGAEEEAKSQTLPTKPARAVSVLPEAPASVHEALRSPGQPLDSESRAFFEPRLNCDLSGVRVHTGARAELATDRLHAAAFTLGEHIAFGPGQYDPRSPAGRSLMGHELVHVLQARAGAPPIIRRRPKADDKPAIIAIEAEYGSNQGTATLSTPTHDTVSVQLRKNEIPVGRWRLIHDQGKVYHFEQPMLSAGKELGFLFVKGTYAWAEVVDITIKPNPKATAAERIEALPDPVRHFLTTGGGRAAGEPELQSAAEAGELLAEAGFTEEEATLLEEKARVAKERGHPLPEADQYQWAQSYLKGRARGRQEAANAADDLLEASRQLADEPFDFLANRREIEAVLDDPDEKLQLSIGIALFNHYTSQGWLNDIRSLTGEEKEEFFLGLTRVLQARLLHFESLLLKDLRTRAIAGLDSADAALLQMDRRFVGRWQPAEKGPGFLSDVLARIRNDPDIKTALDVRAKVERGLDLASQEDYKASYHPPQAGAFRGVVPGYVSEDYKKREEVRNEQRKLAAQAFTEVVRKKGRFTLPPRVDALEILEAKDAERAQRLLKNYLYSGREKIAKARGSMSDPKFVFAADIWLKQEDTWFREQLGGTLGSDIARLTDALASFRRSETSLWEDLLKIMEFVAVFIPGPAGWILRAGTALIESNKTLMRLADQLTLAGVGASAVDPSSGEALRALVDFAVNLVPDASVLGEGTAAGENLAKREIERKTESVAKQGAEDVKPDILPESTPEPEPRTTEPIEPARGDEPQPAQTIQAAKPRRAAVQPTKEAVKKAEQEVENLVERRYGPVRDLSDLNKDPYASGVDRLFIVGQGEGAVLLHVDAKLSIQEGAVIIREVSAFETAAKTGGKSLLDLLEAALKEARITPEEYQFFREDIEQGLVLEEVHGFGSVSGISEELRLAQVTYVQGEQFVHITEQLAERESKELSTEITATIVKPAADRRTAKQIANELYKDFEKEFGLVEKPRTRKPGNTPTKRPRRS
jgi:hypothetical protein